MWEDQILSYPASQCALHSFTCKFTHFKINPLADLNPDIAPTFSDNFQLKIFKIILSVHTKHPTSMQMNCSYQLSNSDFSLPGLHSRRTFILNIITIYFHCGGYSSEQLNKPQRSPNALWRQSQILSLGNHFLCSLIKFYPQIQIIHFI